MACCSGNCASSSSPPANPRYRRVLWIALILNAAMFFVEIAGGMRSGSVSLLADAVDFAGDAANYGLSLAVLGMGLMWRARAALVKGLTMGAYGVLVLGKTAWNLAAGDVPEPYTMGAVAILALAVNLAVAVMLYAWREGDANMRSVWLCSRNDAISNLAVAAAALGVFGTSQAWPDLLVAAIMAGLALTAAVVVVRQARQELASLETAPPAGTAQLLKSRQG
ncbi:cation transporter [Azoarcus sp. TTM-91]|uniref:cation transporter n=1 Tax=Azoarcus sp. TTM-91 TaxID=2691581 RepID=UPI00145EAE09|nr:cation transporter [Azoarcus sp. TTM-91]NMG33352.1 cation transporter [Azoarcus sp. TTM-91]